MGRSVVVRVAAAGVLSAGALAATAPAAGAGSAPTAGALAPGRVPVLVVSGRGLGHGVGLAQDGAYWMGRDGASTGQILGQFYPGTALAQVSGRPQVDVVVGGASSATTLSFPQGGQVQVGQGGPQPTGFPVQVAPGGAVTVSYANSTYTASAAGPQPVSYHQPLPPLPTTPPTTTPPTTTPPSSTTTTTPPRTTTTSSGSPPSTGEPGSTTSTTSPSGGHPHTQPKSGTTTTTGPGGPNTATSPTTGPGTASPGPRANAPLWGVPAGEGTVGVAGTDREYRGSLEVAGEGGSGFTLINQVDVEDYLRGMGEVLDPAWAPASLQAQAIVERTYALRAMSTSGQLCDDQRCQVYLGAQVEYPAMDQAVAATAGQVLVYGGQLATTVFSANAGGVTATPEEGFGSSSNAEYPYLRAAPYFTQDTDPFHLSVSLADVAARMGYPGQITGVAITERGPSGRALAVTLEGTAGPQTVPGLTFSDDLGLGSNLITVDQSSAAVAPRAPPPPVATQAPPNDAAALDAAVAAPAPLPPPVPTSQPTTTEPGPLPSLAAATGPTPLSSSASSRPNNKGNNNKGKGTTPWELAALALLALAAGATSALALARRRTWLALILRRPAP